jgi:hypothetical protein
MAKGPTAQDHILAALEFGPLQKGHSVGRLNLLFQKSSFYVGCQDILLIALLFNYIPATLGCSS